LRRLSRRAAKLACEGEHAAAARIWEELAQIEPEHEQVAAGLGSALLAAGEDRKAAQVLRTATRAHPGNPLLFRLHGQALTRLGEGAAAVGALYMALELDPASVEINANLAKALHEQRRPGAALPHAAAAFKQEPSVSHAALLSGILIDLGRSEDALSIAESVEVNADALASKLVLRSLCLQLLDRYDESLTAAREALAAAPEDNHAKTCLGMSLLLRGHLTAEAWSLYESRASLIGNVKRWPSPERRWTGGDISGRTLLVYAEQGFGDTLQFARYLPLIADRGARVILAVQPALRRLMENVPGADLVISGGSSTLPDFDLYCPLLSLPGIVGTTIDTIPPPLRLAAPRAPAERGDGLQVGLVWAGNGVFVDDARRSLDPAALSPLAEIAGVSFHSLQFGAKTMPFPGIRDAMQDVKDFADTAERIAALDLVIAVDTSVAHLAATMGKPVWLLSRKSGCWRWLLDRQDSPWYPSVRLYRQARLGDWAGVIDRVCRDLAFVVGKFQAIKAEAA
jgi:Flp pilus assembly protein TadD